MEKQISKPKSVRETVAIRLTHKEITFLLAAAGIANHFCPEPVPGGVKSPLFSAVVKLHQATRQFTSYSSTGDDPSLDEWDAERPEDIVAGVHPQEGGRDEKQLRQDAIAAFLSGQANGRDRDSTQLSEEDM